MVIYLPAQSVEEGPILDELTPREIVRELDKYVSRAGRPPSARSPSPCRNRVCGARSWPFPEMAEDVMPQEHPDDRPDRGRQNGTGAALGQAGQFAVSQGGGQQVHRSRLCGARRGIHDPRSGGDRHRYGARRTPR